MDPHSTKNSLPVLSLSDFWLLCKKRKRFIGFSVAFFALCASSYAMLKPIEYLAEGSFRDKGIAEPGFSKSLSELVLSGVDSDESKAISLLKSKKLINELVIKEGLQAEIKKKELLNPTKLFTRIGENLATELAYIKKQETFSVTRDPPPFKIHNLKFCEECLRKWEIYFRSNQEYEVYDESKNFIGLGILDHPFSYEGTSFVLSLNKSERPQFSSYYLLLHPLQITTEKLTKRFTIEADRSDKELVKIKYLSKDREDSARHVNTLMQIYQEEMENEHGRIAGMQIHYLEKRQEEMNKSLEKNLLAHAQSLSSDMSDTGHFSTTKAMEFLAGSLLEYKKKVMVTDLEIQRLEQIQNGENAQIEKIMTDANSDVIGRLLTEIQSLKQQEDSLHLAISYSSKKETDLPKDYLLKKLEEKKEIELSIEEADALLNSLEKNQFPVISLSRLTNSSFLVKAWLDRFPKVQSGNIPTEEWFEYKNTFIIYLENLIHSMHVQLKSLEDRLVQQRPYFGEFDGINLAMARELYVNYSKELNEVQTKILQQKFIIAQMDEPNFEISSLSTVLQDPVSIEMIGKASSLILALRDSVNRSIKEQERLKVELSIQKGFLANHLNQTVELLKLREDLLKSKTLALQNAHLLLVQEEIAILQDHLSSYIANRLNNLQGERALLEKNIVELKKHMSRLPEKWMREELINYQLILNQKMVEEIAGLVETKNISSHLELIQSAPLDQAKPPLHPVSPKIFLLTVLGACAGAFFGIVGLLITSIIKGIEATEENIRYLNQHVSGSLKRIYSSIFEGPVLDKDLNTLRRAASFISSSEAKYILLLLDNGINYSPNLAELMASTGKKILLLPISFNTWNKDEGFLSFLEGKKEKPDISKGKNYDFIAAGGVARHGLELISTDIFNTFLKEQENKYDHIFLMSEASLGTPEADALMNRFECSILSIIDNSLELIIKSTGLHPKSNISFIFPAKK